MSLWQIGTLVRAGMNQKPTPHGNRLTRGGINNPTTGKPKTNAIAGTEGFERETNSHVQTKTHFRSEDTGTDRDPPSLLPPVSMLWQPSSRIG